MSSMRKRIKFWPTRFNFSPKLSRENIRNSRCRAKHVKKGQPLQISVEGNGSRERETLKIFFESSRTDITYLIADTLLLNILS